MMQDLGSSRAMLEIQYENEVSCSVIHHASEPQMVLDLVNRT